ncbi:MAG: hypothetical protein Q9227_000641 [Pyrenula ochraceoflavens]
MQPAHLLTKNENDIYKAAEAGMSASPPEHENKSGQHGAPSSSPSSLPITYRYLSFSTSLPTPYLHPSRSHPTPPPPCPDLSPYASPFLWSSTRKNTVLLLSLAISIFAAYSAGSYTIPAPYLEAKFNISSVAYLTGITAFCLGFGSAPMFLAPFSEINGRRPVFIASAILFLVSIFGCGATDSFAGMIVARVFVGIGASTFATMVGGILSDVYETRERNTPMALYSGTVLLGTGLGPLMSGFIVEGVGWRWVFYVHGIIVGVLTVAATLLFKETRGSVLLSRKAKVLNRWYEKLEKEGYEGMVCEGDGEDGEKSRVQRIRWKVKSDEERASLLTTIAISLYRPFHLLFTEPVVFFFSLWAAFAWGVLYLQFDAIPLIYQSVHHFSLSSAGAVFASTCIGSLLATLLSIIQEPLARRYFAQYRTNITTTTTEDSIQKPNNPPLTLRSRLANLLCSHTPESRLAYACPTSLLLPLGLLLFSLTSPTPSIHWALPTFALILATIGIFSIYLAVFNYLADTYHVYASSAIAGQSFARNLLGAVFPLFAVQMFERLGTRGAGGLLCGLAAGLSVVPWVLVRWGEGIRGRSRFAREVVGVEGR